MPTRQPLPQRLPRHPLDRLAGLKAPRRSWYEQSCAEPPLGSPDVAPRPLSGRVETTACVLGGGLAGLAVLLSLAERGIPAVLLEAGRVGDGASGRNGGMATAGFTVSSLDLARRIGLEAASAMHAASTEALSLIRERVARHGIATSITEGVVVASFFEGGGLLRETLATNATFGMRLEPKGRAWMAAHYASPRYVDGVLDPEGFHLDPLALTRGYARASVTLGARIHEASPAVELAHESAPPPRGAPTRLDRARPPPMALGREGSAGVALGREGSAAMALTREGSLWRLRTPEGEIHAPHVVLATSAYGDPLWPELRRAILPIATYVIVTEPLGERLSAAIRAPYAVWDDRFATGYYRPLADGRLLWGGRISLDEHPVGLEALMRHDLAFVYPQLADAPIAAAWSGRMGFARHKMPLIGKLAPGLWVSTGFGGHGLNATTMAGELVADAIGGDEARLAPFARFAPRPVFGRLGRLAAQGIYWSLAGRDALRLRRPGRARARVSD